MGVKSMFGGFFLGLATGFIAYTVNEMIGLGIGIVCAGLFAKGPFSGGFAGLFIGVALPALHYLITLLMVGSEVDILYLLLLFVTRTINIYNLWMAIAGFVIGAVFGIVGNKLSQRD
ncbi:MAG: hypothetical protein J7L50_02955 [Candidatus Odinarchaeota archaeon]|nr:hypothetical protein [Candidatus Odinarchaeota archaeon]